MGLVVSPLTQETNMTNWKQTAAAAIVQAPVIAPQGDTSDLSLWHQLKAAIEAGKVAAGSLGFAQSVMQGFQKYGSFTPKQADAVRNLIARSNGQAEPRPVEGPDAALAASLRAALPNLPQKDVSFATSLLSGFDRFGSFTDRQRPYAEKFATQYAAPAQVEEPIRPAPKLYPNICSKVNLNGFSRFTVDKLQLSLKNDGSCIWIKWDGRIIGSIDSATFELRTTRRYATQYAVDQGVIQLDRIETDPLAAARENGVLTGRCSCCGRPLTDPVSIEFGLGPICRERGFGIML
jgi:hypothetical protein